MEIATAASAEEMNTTIRRVNFDYPEWCAFTDSIECSIDSRVIRGVNWNWRDLLVAVTEHLLRSDESKVAQFAFQSGKPFMTKQKPGNCVCRQLRNKQFIVVTQLSQENMSA